ncbi:uncharacterized protein GGS22DRAFT_190491 [Annulohypoxylon maeteangense]|uniref:uncharacterized protein n=1 Tax=Annulohypoxylon maeteangense TaxID=1927788 RepID=UPI00200857D7|nr:uncharacterized protein GGS22DRAFT_190491 [Annulohypoxylon maeteangense]KAI0883178.1 hypothetical protein GGS22DRAFT_190491 [Annulohypoxylon maeteangense]
MRPLPKVSLKLLKKLLSRRSTNDASSSSNTTTITSAHQQHQHHHTNPPTNATTTAKKPDIKQKQRILAPEPPEECPICHDPVGLANPEGIIESWTSLHCGHRFGTHCIQTWLQESINRDQTANPSCPICRTTAKHPCGHLISPPPFASMHHYPSSLDWTAPRPPPSPPRHQQRQVRRRLTRRPGHPLRPPPADLNRRTAQTVGECRTCAENADFDARMQRIRERGRQATGDSGVSSGSRGAAAIKAMIPGLGLKRSGANTFRATVVQVGLDPLEGGGRQRSSVFCGAATRGRRGTPPPGGFGRRLSI